MHSLMLANCKNFDSYETIPLLNRPSDFDRDLLYVHKKAILHIFYLSSTQAVKLKFGIPPMEKLKIVSIIALAICEKSCTFIENCQESLEIKLCCRFFSSFS